jgi:dTDP-4-amino-4,6-dideoxygalactose transaminase
MQKIPLSQCFVDAEVEEAALRAMRSGQYILGPECETFEQELAMAAGVKHCALASSCTMAMYLLLRARELKPGDEVIVPSHTAFPTIEPLLHGGATPVFVDIDDTYCLDPAQLEGAITPRTVGIIPVHLYGHPADMDAVTAVAAKHKLWVVEDCAQAQGATHRGRPVGSIGGAGAFSFFPSKNLTVLGDGGCICSDDAELIGQLRMLRNHGRREKYRHEIAGFNLRFNEIQAAIGRVMLRHLEAFNETRRRIAARYNERLGGIVRTPPERSWARAVYHMYVVRAERRDDLQTYLKKKQIETGIHYPVPNHQQPAITSRFDKIPSLPRTEEAVLQILSLPIHGRMTLNEADVVCDAIEKFHGR